jgi:hypothetical protein
MYTQTTAEDYAIRALECVNQNVRVRAPDVLSQAASSCLISVPH